MSVLVYSYRRAAPLHVAGTRPRVPAEQLREAPYMYKKAGCR
jgi:hypothetical protein